MQFGSVTWVAARANPTQRSGEMLLCLQAQFHGYWSPSCHSVLCSPDPSLLSVLRTVYMGLRPRDPAHQISNNSLLGPLYIQYVTSQDIQSLPGYRTGDIQDPTHIPMPGEFHVLVIFGHVRCGSVVRRFNSPLNLKVVVMLQSPKTPRYAAQNMSMQKSHIPNQPLGLRVASFSIPPNVPYHMGNIFESVDRVGGLSEKGVVHDRFLVVFIVRHEHTRLGPPHMWMCAVAIVLVVVGGVCFT